jgi:integrase
MNLLLENYERDLQTIILNLKLENIEPTLLNVKNEYYKTKNKLQENIIGPRKIDERKFINDFQEYVDKREYNKLIKSSTIKAYKTTKQKLINFQKKKNFDLQYDNIKDNFYTEFLKYLREDEGLFDNSIDKHIKNLKVFMNYALENKMHNNHYYHIFKRTRVKADFIYLEPSEIKKLYYDYTPSTKNYSEIRDMFILGCATGLRFSDLASLSTGNFIIKRDEQTNEIIQDANESYILVRTIKTDEKIRIPINNFICDLIDKYEIGKKEITFLKQNNQVFNREIKKICKDAGITSIVKIKRKKGVESEEYEKAKCEFVSSHTMRRTFITLLASRTEITNIQAVSGHKDIKVLTDYIKRNDKELNSVRGSFNEIFYKSKADEKNEPSKVKATIIKSRVITN